MSHKLGSNNHPPNPVPTKQPFTAADVRLMLSTPVYAYGTCGLQPAKHVAEEVMKLNAQLTQELRETGASFILSDLDQRFQALLNQLEDDGICRRDMPAPPIIPKELIMSHQAHHST